MGGEFPTNQNATYQSGFDNHSHIPVTPCPLPWRPRQGLFAKLASFWLKSPRSTALRRGVETLADRKGRENRESAPK